jgi:hypothetical protein
MMNFESVKLRLDREQPLTFLEFNYMILQVGITRPQVMVVAGELELSVGPTSAYLSSPCCLCLRNFCAGLRFLGAEP